MTILSSLQDNAPDAGGILRALANIFLSILSCAFMGFISKLFPSQGVIILVFMIALSLLSSLIIMSLGFCFSYWREGRS